MTDISLVRLAIAARVRDLVQSLRHDLLGLGVETGTALRADAQLAQMVRETIGVRLKIEPPAAHPWTDRGRKGKTKIGPGSAPR